MSFWAQALADSGRCHIHERPPGGSSPGPRLASAGGVDPVRRSTKPPSPPQAHPSSRPGTYFLRLDAARRVTRLAAAPRWRVAALAPLGSATACGFAALGLALRVRARLAALAFARLLELEHELEDCCGQDHEEQDADGDGGAGPHWSPRRESSTGVSTPDGSSTAPLVPPAPSGTRVTPLPARRPSSSAAEARSRHSASRP